MHQNIPTSRRSFLKISGLGSFSVLFPKYLKSMHNKGISHLYKGLKTGRYLGKVIVETRITDEKIFTEGPATDKYGQLYFTNIPMQKILKWDPRKKVLSVFSDASESANGLRFDRNGQLLVCEGGSGNIVRIDPKTNLKSVIADTYQGKKIQSPNDLDIDSRGRIYFSSRSSNPDLEKENVRAVYRVDPDGSVHQLLKEPQIHMPNGIVIFPDEKTLYLIEADGAKDRNRKILKFDLADDGFISNAQTIIDFYPGRSGDGMCIDKAGNLYVAAGLHKTRNSSETLDTRPGIHVISPQGKLVAFRETPEDTITNCTFGGKDMKTLFITCGSYLLRVRTKIPGKVM